MDTGQTVMSGMKTGTMSPTKTTLRSTIDKRYGAVSPLRLNNPAKGAFRVAESGERRVVNAASRQHWDFARDNIVQLKQHINELRFQNNGPQTANANQLKNTSTTILVKLGLSKINTPSLEFLPKQEPSIQTGPSFEHSLREGAPRNKLSSTDNGKLQRIISHFKTEDQNFGAKNSLNISKPQSPQLFDQSFLASRGNSMAVPEANRSMHLNFGHERKSSGQIFETKNRASQDIIFSNFL